MKRKFSSEFDDEVAYSSVKRPNLIPFPITDTDVAMSDASSDTELLTPLDFPDYSHSRFNSNASNASSVSFSQSSSTQNSPNSSPFYPDFVLYPSVDQDIATNAPNRFDNSPANYSPKQVGLMQPRGTAFTHHGQNCSQIPKLRMACAAGLHGQRTMWAHCEQCGAIEMVDTD